MERHDEQRHAELVELGSATVDTQGSGGKVMEGTDFQPQSGMSDD